MVLLDRVRMLGEELDLAMNKLSELQSR